MSAKLERILKSEEFHTLNNEAIANGMYSMDRRVFLAGMGWEMDWYYDPSGEREASGKRVMFTAKDREDILAGRKESHFLSMHYWKDWSHIRPPVTVVAPNRETWEIDRLSSNGSGWKVTGFFPLITCDPSVVLKGYHGRLIKGQFSEDLEGRGPNGSFRA